MKVIKALMLGVALLPMVASVQAKDPQGVLQDSMDSLQDLHDSLSPGEREWHLVTNEGITIQNGTIQFKDNYIKKEVNKAMKGYCLVAAKHLQSWSYNSFVKKQGTSLIDLRSLTERADLVARHCSKYMENGKLGP